MTKDPLPRWTISGLTPAPDAAELERLCRLGDRVAAVSFSVARMPFKDDEPASIFKVPL